MQCKQNESVQNNDNLATPSLSWVAFPPVPLIFLLGKVSQKTPMLRSDPAKPQSERLIQGIPGIPGIPVSNVSVEERVTRPLKA